MCQQPVQGMLTSPSMERARKAPAFWPSCIELQKCAASTAIDRLSALKGR